MFNPMMGLFGRRTQIQNPLMQAMQQQEPYGREGWSPYARNVIPQNLPGMYSGYGPFGQGPALDPNHMAMQMRMYQMNPYRTNQQQYSYMPAMQMPGPFIPTATVTHPQMGGTSDFANNQPNPGGGVTPGAVESVKDARTEMQEAQKRANNFNTQMIGHGPAPAGSLWGLPTRMANQQAAKAKTAYEQALYDALIGGRE